VIPRHDGKKLDSFFRSARRDATQSRGTHEQRTQTIHGASLFKVLVLSVADFCYTLSETGSAAQPLVGREAVPLAYWMK
jgi:hypothetical protein